MDEPLLLAAEVADALAENRPIVALESSIVAQGLPEPDNLRVGQGMQDAVRQHGAVPAMTAVLDGRVRVGLSVDDMTRLAAHPDGRKCGARDLGPALALGLAGATTVSATVTIAAAAGIAVFGTGGIGGVHRMAPGSGTSPKADISADLLAMSRVRVAVVSSGAKSLLDLPTTLETLEALGVPVLGFGCDRFPAFYTAESDLNVTYRFDDMAMLAAALRGHWALPHTGGALVCNPPPEEVAMAADEVEALVLDATAAAHAAGISGGELTPFVLSHMRRASGDQTLRVNAALAIANAGLAGKLAASLAISLKDPAL
ncbi:MAG: pseudouridine-5'-phosphate glycosidase [Rhodospirillaceae bacterium]|jgi:pseudouridine-5'-phosphate glycosidase|nr:pseudouridine-5'-phosphate glycosidase [Rhodospirillaceae bacterium]MBT4691226.1 pseudouridine-5'-phosphate glycosidase [Rhodospirillaceae bacterium]MBT5082513.1 pseudouridine-5'-phosphate glycosidase [Rhodospirillaceae bacterium]MBT5525388.1 pseudouridine-5'-phosphate glycosidase [Rhodospirillaceae bacterium]MBT5880083.1 pseudouridine-5'-phosphate glycosidase [Rhodospirillaceae bacterium]